MAMILAMRAFFLLSLFAFLGTQARTLPELHDKFNISNTNYGRASSPPPPSPASSQPSKNILSVAPFMSKSLGNVVVQTIPCSSYVGMTRNGLRPNSPPPPAPHTAPPHTPITSTSGIAYDKVTKMTMFNGVKPKRSPPPPPYIAPPHIQITRTSCVSGSSCNKVPPASSSGRGAI